MSSDSSPDSSENMSSRVSVAVVGGGVIGLSLAWRLAQGGANVTLVDAGPRDMGGTWAAAGMLAPNLESRDLSAALVAFNHDAAGMWPAFASELEDSTGIEIGYRVEGTLLIDPAPEDEVNGSLKNTDELHKLEPFLAAHHRKAVFFERDHAVDARALLRALTWACRQVGVTMRNDTSVERLQVLKSSQFRLSVPALGEFDKVVLATGAWTKQLLEQSNIPVLPIDPIKGQMLCLQMDPETPLVRHVMWGEGVYLVPRTDGRLVIGATMEDAGFDTSITTEAIAGLRLRAQRLVPGLSDLPVNELWTGFRAGSPDMAPLLGPWAYRNLFVAAGHHRNGILQAPATAEDLSRQILTDHHQERLIPFSPSRFWQQD